MNRLLKQLLQRLAGKDLNAEALSSISAELPRATVHTVKYMDPNRSIIYDEPPRPRNAVMIHPHFDMHQLAQIYDSVSGDRPIIIKYKGDITITTHAHLFSWMGSLFGIQDEHPYEVVYPDDLETIVPIESDGFVFTGTFRPVKKLIRHAVDKDLFMFRSTLGETVITEDHSLVFIDGSTGTINDIEKKVPGIVAYIKDVSLQKTITYKHSASTFLGFARNRVVVHAPSLAEFVKFMIVLFEYGDYGVFHDQLGWRLPVCPFLIRLIDDNNYQVIYDDEYIFVSNDSQLGEILSYLLPFGLDALPRWFFDEKFVNIAISIFYNEWEGYLKAHTPLVAAYLSFLLRHRGVQFALNYDDNGYKFIDIRNFEIPIIYSDMQILPYMNDDQYVYDVSVEGEVFVDPVGFLTLHNTEAIVRRGIEEYVIRIPWHEVEVISDSIKAKNHLLRRLQIMRRRFNCDLLGEFSQSFIRQLLLFGNVFIRIVYSRETYEGRKLPLYPELLYPPDVTIMYDIKRDKIIGYTYDRYVFKPERIIHVTLAKFPGYFYGNSILSATVEDVKVLRLLEQQAEIMSVLYSSPQIFLKVGTPTIPAGRPPNDLLDRPMMIDALTEDDLVREGRRLESSEPHSLKIIPYYDEPVAISPEAPIDLEPFLKHFKNRVYQALGIDPVILGDPQGANRDTSVIGESATNKRIEYIARLWQRYINFIINDIFMSEVPYTEPVYVHLPKIDTTDYMARIRLGLNLYQNGIITNDEMRRLYLGYDPLSDDELARTIFGLTGRLVINTNEIESQLSPENQYGRQMAPPKVKRR